MLFVKHLLDSSGLENELLTKPSVACINTTRPIYLVFGHNQHQPLLIIRKVNGADEVKASQVDRYMHQIAGDLVPTPLGVYKLNGETYDIQRGVGGYPWFQLKSKVRTHKARVSIENRMWQSLYDFHAAVRRAQANSEVRVVPHIELQKSIAAYESAGERSPQKLRSIADRAFKELLYTPTCLSIPQHGDFCLNNLIIDKCHITVIDFEDFEITRMPLYDAFTLTLTLPSFDNSVSNAAQAFTHPKIISIVKHYGVAEATIRWHFFHHLLLRLGPWSAGGKRTRYRAWLNKVLDEFIDQQLKNYTNDPFP
ncbi:phosphotransferase [Marinobacter piscensis]|uniref:phosphotransferase n=1 Tax=Marinobacter piscensis TaxID=1562308 RepID=UPI0011A80862|nr:phosphotransferase [Marinobacter piscensis]